MGLFPRTVGKRFSRARTSASRGTHPRPRQPARGDGKKADARAGLCGNLHLYPAPQDVVLTSMPFTGSRGSLAPHRAGFMRDPASGLRRIVLPRTRVNRAQRRDKTRRPRPSFLPSSPDASVGAEPSPYSSTCSGNGPTNSGGAFCGLQKVPGLGANALPPALTIWP